jgi:Uma2 family endonuclease
MKTVVLGDPPPALASLIAERQRLGLDRHDEVWRGEYHMAPAASFEHGAAEAILARLFWPPATERDLVVGMAFNLGRKRDFRVPDMGVHRGRPSGVWHDTAAMVVEVRSPDDETYDKFEFYFEHDVEEVLVTDLVTYEVQWYRRGAKAFVTTEASDLLGLTEHEVRDALRW